MKKWIPRCTILLLFLAMLSSIPALPLGVELRGYWLQIHMMVAVPLSLLIVAKIWWVRAEKSPLNALAWLSISVGLGLIVVPLLALSDAASTHYWVEAHGWVSILGVGMLGFSVARISRKSEDS